MLPELHLYHWLGFAALVVVLLVLDLCVFHRHDHTPSLKESAWWTVFWVALAMTFNAILWWRAGSKVGGVWLTGYIVEEALSMDNMFVFVVIFRFFAVPRMHQYRVLFWGILGAIVMRLSFILAGVELINRFDWVMPLFGVFLLYTAYKLTAESDVEVHPENNIVLRTARRFLRITKGNHEQYGHAFFRRENGLLCITPLFLVLLVIESTDVVFAVDSVPAVIGVVVPKKLFGPDWIAFIAFTSNVFAILGLRALYFLLAGMVDIFRYLHFGLAGVLGFVGVKMIAEYAVPLGLDHGWLHPAWFPWYHHGRPDAHLVPIWASLGTIALLLGVSMLFSVLAARREDPDEPSRQE
jgi:tellurite resistance protein TerC